MTHKLKIQDIRKDDISYIKQLCKENDCDFSVEWQSKYNNYVMYDYEPFNSDSFMINVHIKSENINNAQFVKYLYNKRIESINKLDKLLNNEGVKI